MICTTFWCTFQPSGRKVYSPAPTWRTKPPRRRSLCETASASPGSSRRVGMNSCEARVATSGYRLVEWDLRGLGHRQGGRLGHLQALRAVHALGDPAVDLVEELLDE